MLWRYGNNIETPTNSPLFKRKSVSGVTFLEAFVKASIDLIIRIALSFVYFAFHLTRLTSPLSITYVY